MYESQGTPLFVDLDGTYTKTDLLFESFVSALKKNPLVLFYCIFWLLQGKAYLKDKLAKAAEVNTQLLPLNSEFYAFLKGEKNRGRRLILATATNKKFAEKIVGQSSIFDDYISSSEQVNLRGKEKLKKIQECSPVFAYAGNEVVDLDIFEYAEEAILVNPSAEAKRLACGRPNITVFDNSSFSAKTWVKQLRLHQWLKNTLVFVPLVVSGAFADLGNIVTSLVAFFAFGCLASSTYILNDLLDLEADRSHPRKKYRPLAAGDISIRDGGLVGGILFGCAFGIAFSLGIEFAAALLAYFSLTLFYSFKLKQYVGMDVVALSLLFTVRIVAGAAAISVDVSFWLFAFSVFIFLSLALVKRCSEIQSMGVEGVQRAKGRDYMLSDYVVLTSFGSASAMLALLMFCFYVNNNVLTNQYQQPTLLWLIVPALCYWLMRMWIKTHRGEMHDDPIVFTLKDYGSLVTVFFSGVIAIMAQIL